MPELHIALRHTDNAIVYSGTDFLEVFRNAPADTGLVTEQYLISGKNRKAELVNGLNKLFEDHYEEPAQRVDLAVEWLRREGVLCERYTSRLLSESRYGTLPRGSVSAMVIAVGMSPHARTTE